MKFGSHIHGDANLLLAFSIWRLAVKNIVYDEIADWKCLPWAGREPVGMFWAFASYGRSHPGLRGA